MHVPSDFIAQRGARRWPGACSATRRGAWCSTTARSRRSCPEFEATIPLPGRHPPDAGVVCRRREPPGRRRGGERGDGPHSRRVRGQVGRRRHADDSAERSPIVTEREKMLGGEPYDASDPELVEAPHSRSAPHPATRHARSGRHATRIVRAAPRPSRRASARARGSRRRSTATTGRRSASALACSSTWAASSSTQHRSRSATTCSSGRGCSC